MALIMGLKKFKFIVALAILMSLFGSQAVFADQNLSISITPNGATFSATPEIFSTVTQSITASTDNTTGYTVKLQPAEGTTSLVNISDSTITIPTFTLPEGSTNLPVNSTGYGYGYSIDGGENYLPITSDVEELFRTDAAGESSHTLIFGANVSSETPAGTYTNSFTIYATANLNLCPAGNICYYGNNDDGTGTMSNQVVTDSSNVTLIASNFSRSGYGFVGWNTSEDGTGTNYGPNQTINAGDLSTVGLQLYAKWIPSAGDLQSWNGCDAMTSVVYNQNTGEITVAANSITALTDTRDGNTYAIAKYPDGQCWMMENLRLDLSDPDLEINGLNTNRPTTTFAQAIDNNHPASTNDFCAANNQACIDRILFNKNNTNRSLTASYDTNNTTSSWYSYGNYYNWYTITAGNGTYSMSTGGSAASGDLCPASWRLPAGYGDVGDLSILDVAIGGTGSNQTSEMQTGVAGSARWRTYPYNFIYSGEQKGNTAANRASSSSYATLSAATNNERTTNLWLKTNGVYVKSNFTLKYRGQTARCLFSGGYHVTGNIHYDANGGTGTMTDQTDVDFGTALAANNEFTKEHSIFANWNSQPDGSGVAVTEGGMVAGAADRMGLTNGDTLTLYAIWKSQFSLTYDGNGADAGAMTNAGTNNLVAGKYSLIASNFSRTGYGFAGWSLDSSAATKIANGETVTIYGPNEVINVDNAFLSNADANNRITLYAVWLPENTTYTMQTFRTTECANLSIGDVLALKDVRDNNVYTVAKLKDGKCWMSENLRFDPSSATLNNDNTNLPTADFIAAAPNSATNNTLCKTDDTGCVDTIRFNSNAINRNLSAAYGGSNANSSWYSYGIMYNWYTASAGNGTFDMDSGNTTGDICPAGWRLPTGGSNGETVTLNNLANSGSTSTDAGLTKFPNNFIYSGDYNYNTPGGRNSYGRYWTSTPNGTTKAYRLGTATSGATPTGSWNKWDAFAVRCVVK